MSDVPLLRDHLGKNVADYLAQYYPYLYGFHRDVFRSCYLYLTSPLQVNPTYLVRNDRLALPNVELYDVKAGAKQGMRCGFVIRSPLPCVYDRSYLLFHRHHTDPKEIVLTKQAAARNYSIENLQFFTLQDDAVLISKLEKGVFTDFLET